MSLTPDESEQIHRIAVADARLADVSVDTTPLAHLHEMNEDEAIEAIDSVNRAIMFDGL
ncbi:hypothetical protein GCM10009733_020860 [Nonomuraea maheshkhaliensis]|uniref:FXSXX-COOH protein n=1 Tax=Nonomuraea maheshkhaliensis TaxID=419590 RepID=A0ABP4QVG8_9ACTN